MIKVTIEIYPYGKEEEKRQIGGLCIWNDGSGDHNIGNYEFMLGTDPTDLSMKISKVKGHRRVQGHLKLIYLCLKKIYGK